MRMSVVAAVVCLSIGLSGAAEVEAAARKQTNIPAQGLGPALQTLAKERSFQLIYVSEEINDVRTPGAVGEFTSQEALQQLLNGTGLTFRYLDEQTVTIVPLSTNLPSARGGVGRGEASSSAGEASSIRKGFRLAQGETRPSTDTQARRTATENVQGRIELEEIVVTGTRVKGVKDRFAPVTTITRDQMDLAGQSNVSDVLGALPQNFGGGVTPDTTSANSAEGAGSSSVNLRGLGNEATLILLNGRRLAPSGVTGNVVDISAIPTSAIDRIEVLADGASAVYGADAIGGVVNIILREDFNGAESRLDFSTTADGGGDAFKAGQTFGWAGDRAYGIATYEYASREELNANDREFLASREDPTDILPHVRGHAVFVSGGIEVSERASVTADGYYNKRKTESFNSFSGNQDFQRLDIEQLGASAGLHGTLAGDWEADLSGAYARSSFISDYMRVVPVNGGTVDSDSQTDILSVDASVGGSLFNVTQEAIKGVFGVHYRSEKADLTSIGNPGGIVRVDTRQSRDVLAAFAEIYAPLISVADAIPVVNELTLTMAARYDDYSDVGSSFDPKIGFVWSPFGSFNVRGTYGTSFRAARLEQLRDSIPVARLGIFVDPEAPTGESVALLVLGTKSDIDPEEATTWTAGIDFMPEFLDGLRLRGTYFNIDYDGRLGAPSARFDGLGRWSVFTGIPTRDVAQSEVQQLLAGADLIQDLSVFFPYLSGLTPEDVTVVLDSRQQNLSRSKVEGVDLEVACDVPSASGNWTFSVASTLLTSFTQQVTPATPVLDLLDTFANPVDLRVRGNVTWQTPAIAAALYVNYADNYTDDEVSSGVVAISSWTTVDVALRLDLGKVFGGGIAEGTFLSLSVTNVFNEDPPEIVITPARAALGVLYDAVNADPTGRRLGVVLTKRW